MTALEAAKLFRQTLGHYPTGVCVIAARDDQGRAEGMTVGTFSSVSLEPPLVGFLPSKISTSWPQIERVGRFCANVLSSEQGWLCQRFASQIDDKFDGVAYSLSPGGQPILADAVAWIDCTIYSVHEAGDHLFVLGEVDAHDAKHGALPLLFFRGQYGRFAPLPSLAGGAA